jgi:hypothetical protein
MHERGFCAGMAKGLGSDSCVNPRRREALSVVISCWYVFTGKLLFLHDESSAGFACFSLLT